MMVTYTGYLALELKKVREMYTRVRACLIASFPKAIFGLTAVKRNLQFYDISENLRAELLASVYKN